MSHSPSEIRPTQQPRAPKRGSGLVSASPDQRPDPSGCGRGVANGHHVEAVIPYHQPAQRALCDARALRAHLRRQPAPLSFFRWLSDNEVVPLCPSLPEPSQGFRAFGTTRDPLISTILREGDSSRLTANPRIHVIPCAPRWTPSWKTLSP